MSFKSSSASAPNLGAVENESPSSTKSLSHTELLHDTQTGSSMPESGINLAEEINSTSTLVLDRQNTKTKPVKEKWALSTSFGRLFKSASSASPSSSNSSLESEIDWRLILPSTHEQASLTYAAPGTIRRLKALHQIYEKLNEASLGINFRTIKVPFKSPITNAFTGADLLDWFGPFENDMERQDSLSICHWLLHAGFIISLDQSTSFNPSSNHYIFQRPAFLPRADWSPSDSEYARYLLRKSQLALPKYFLAPFEVPRLAKLNNMLIQRWPAIEKQVEKDLTYDFVMGSDTFKMYRIQESIFWNNYRPAEGDPEEFMNLESIRVKKKRMTDVEYEESFSDNVALLEWKKKRLEQLRAQDAIVPTKVSQSSSGLIDFCATFGPVDALINSTTNNPWTTDDERSWDTARIPANEQIVFWKSSFQNLFKDPLGLHYFSAFLQKEFSDENLAFVLDTQALIKCYSKEDFYKSSQAIYDKYIAVGSPKEINIVSQIKNRLHEQFRDPQDLNNWSDYACFEDAVDHVMHLMGNDSYNRFCKSL